jgi:hypothetical protein
MKKVLLGTIVLAMAFAVPVPAMAEVDVSIGISLPPAIVFQAPPEVIVLPETSNVYIVPDIEIDLFFWNGWWWRPWEGRWYRSRYYNRGWVYYRSVPSFYYDVDPGWRRSYREHAWYGHPWRYERIPNRRLQQNWKSWNTNRYWERQRTWGVQNYRPHPPKQRQELRHQRQEEYRQRPEVQRHEQQKMQQQKQQPQRKQMQRQRPQGQEPQTRPQVQQPGRPQPPQQRQPEPRGEKRQGESPHQRFQEKPDRGNEGHGR